MNITPSALTQHLIISSSTFVELVRCVFSVWLLTCAFNGLWPAEVVINPVTPPSSPPGLVFHTNLTASLPTLSPFLALHLICLFCGLYLESFLLCLSAYVCLYFVVSVSASHLFLFLLTHRAASKVSVAVATAKDLQLQRCESTNTLFNKYDVVISEVGHTWYIWCNRYYNYNNIIHIHKYIILML